MFDHATQIFSSRSSNKHKLKQLLKKTKNIFADIDRAVLLFQKKTSLSCETGCGHCCLSPRVETTVLEMYPLVEHLFQKQQVQAWYEKAQEASFQGPCIFYKPDATLPGKGRCLVYPCRPGICRLYGFSGMTDKRGARHLVTCLIIKNKQGKRIAQIQDSINRGLNIPVMKNFSDKIYQVHPLLWCQRMPINSAFKTAVERMGLYLKCRSLSKSLTKHPRKEVIPMAGFQTKQKQKPQQQQQQQQQQKKQQAPQQQAKKQQGQQAAQSKTAGSGTSSCC